MVLLERRSQMLQNVNRYCRTGLLDPDRLKAALKGWIGLDMLPVLFDGRRAYTSDTPSREGRVGEAAKEDAAGCENVSAVADSTYEQSYLRALDSVLRPEIRGRIHSEVVFRPLTTESIRQIIDLAISRLNSRLASQRILIEVKDDAKAVIAAAGDKIEFGARGMERTIRALLEEPVGRMILQGEIHEGQTAVASGNDGAIVIAVA